jgi:hypothetical protein
MTSPRFSQWHITNKKTEQDKEFQELFPLVLESYILQHLYENLEPGLLKALRDIYLSILQEKVASNLNPEEIEPIEIYEGFIKRLTRLT